MAEFIEEVENDEWEVLSNDGWRDFKGIGKTVPYEVYEVCFESGITLECADDHLVFDCLDDTICVKDLKIDDLVRGKDKKFEVVKSVKKTDRVEDMYDLLDVDGSAYLTNDILSHNSTTFAVWVCHYIIFNEYKEVVILANKQKQSKELLKRIKLAYMELPFWLQTGVRQWNTLNIELDNGCVVSAASTSSDTVRGESLSVLIVDETAFVPSGIWNDFWQSVYPTISAALSSKIILVSCVTKDTMVFTPDGIKEVDDFIVEDNVEGYEVPIYSVAGKNRFNNGTIIYNNGMTKVKKVITTSTELKCSEQHKFWACKEGKYGWFKECELSEGDYISLEYGLNLWGNNDDVSDCCVDLSTISHKNRNIYQFKTITPDLAYFFGLFLAEGYARLSHTKNGDVRGGQVVITCGDDISQSLINLGFKFSCYNGIHYSINSKVFVEYLIKIGFDITKKAPLKTIPKRLMLMSRTNIRHMLRGLMDGDGYSVKTNGKVGISLSSKRMIDQIRMLLLNFGILTDYATGITLPTEKVKAKSRYYRITANNKHSKVYYDEIGFGFERKQLNEQYNKVGIRSGNQDDVVPFSKIKLNKWRKDNKIIKKLVLYSGEHKDKQHFSRSKMLNIKKKLDFNGLLVNEIKEWFDDNVNQFMKWEKIKKIEELPEDYVYDFSLEDVKDDKWDHSVIYNGIIGHQTPHSMNHFYKLWTEAVNHTNKFIPVEINWWDVSHYSKNKFTNHQYEYDAHDHIHRFKKNGTEDIFEMSIHEMFLQLDQRREQKLYQVEQNGVFKHFYGVMKHRERGKTDFTYDIIYNDWRDETIANIGPRKFAQEYEIKFLASTDSLIVSEVVENIVFREHIKQCNLGIFNELIAINTNLDERLHIYKEPIEDHEYSIGVDPAQITEESSGDSVAIQIMDITLLPFEQVGTIIVGEGVHYSELPKIIKTLGFWYNEAQVFIENNDTVGIDIADSLLLDYEYDNIFCEKAGVPGFRTTTKKKKLGCLSLKMLVETGKLLIVDLDTVSQLSTFIKKKNSYEAEVGYNDDAVMALIHSLVFLQDRMGFEHKRQLVDGIKHETFSTIKEKEELEIRRRKEEIYDESEHMPFGYSSGDMDKADNSVF